MSSRWLTLLTPEMVPLNLRIASGGLRLGAFLVDLGLIVVGGGMVSLVVAAILRVLNCSPASLTMVLLLLWFFLRNFYFTTFELAWRGRTPGKRFAGLQVIAADCGPLTPDMIFARNLTREIEIFLPLIAVFLPGAVVPNHPFWVWVGTAMWAGTLMLLPLLNHNQARLGDLIAGTIVIEKPKGILLNDLVAETESKPDAEVHRFQFTQMQLDHYGEYELQVLEDILRRVDEGLVTPEALDAVSSRILAKIQWVEEAASVPSLPFLKAFYAAQRGRLENRLIFGERRESKTS